MAHIPVVTANAGAPAVRISSDSLPCREFIVQVYPATYTGKVYVGRDSTTSTANYVFWLEGGGTIWKEESQNPQLYREDPSSWWFVVDVNGGGFTGGTK